MNVLHRKPTKLTLTAFSDREMTQKSGNMSVMYNPDSVSLDYYTEYIPNSFINTTRQSNRYVQTRPGNLSLELLFDARMPGNRVPINVQLAGLRELCYNVDPANSEPHYLQVKWGKMRWSGRSYFAGRMSSLSVRYTLFERDATPLRATATLVITADGSLTLQGAEEQLKAPATVVATVPNLTSLSQIANSAGKNIAANTNYLALAEANNLDSIDSTVPGQPLLVPSGKRGRG